MDLSLETFKDFTFRETWVVDVVPLDYRSMTKFKELIKILHFKEKMQLSFQNVELKFKETFTKINSKQGCIPVGCVTPACWPYRRKVCIRRGLHPVEGLHPGGSASGGSIGGGLHPGRICTQGGWVDLSMNRMTDRCRNITLPQTSFAGGKKSETNQSVFQKHNPQSRITVISENILNSFNQIQLIF